MQKAREKVSIARYPALMRLDVACEYLSIGETKFRELIRIGKIKPVLIDTSVRYRRIELDDFIDSLPRKT